MKLTGIYKIQSQCKPERIYIGSAVNIHKRWLYHLEDLKGNRHHSKKLQRHYNKYGKDDLRFSVLIGCDKDDLIKTEQYYIDVYNPYFNGSPTAGSTLGNKMSEEAKAKMRKPKSIEARKNMSIAKTGKPSPKKGLKGLNVGWHQTDEAKEKIRKALKGKPKSEKHKEKLKQRRASEETKRKQSIAHIGKVPWNKGIEYSISKVRKSA